jgi:dihydroneopterin aldolase
MDLVYIRELEIDTVIGIYDWEREKKQTISLDLEMAADIRPAARDDDIRLALDYKLVAKRVIAFVESSEFFLVETLAEEVARIVIEEFNVPWLKLRAGKPGAVTGSREVGVIIERGNRDAKQRA